MNFDSENITRKSLLLASVPRAAQDKILATAREREMERGATIFLQGERASSVYIVVEGWVKLYRVAPNGTEEFKAIDANHDGYLSEGEVYQFRKHQFDSNGNPFPADLYSKLSQAKN